MKLKFTQKSACYIIATILANCCVVNSIFSQIPSPIPNIADDPGKCYAECIIPDVYDGEIVHELIKYIGDDYNQDGVEYIKYELEPATTKWVKKIDPTLKSSNQEEEEEEEEEEESIWCLQETPPEIIEYYTVTDTNLIKEFNIESIKTKILVKSGDYTEKFEVICEEDMPDDFIGQIQMALISQEYDFGPSVIYNEMCPATKATLAEFQQNNALPMGQLDMETLKALGVL